MSRLLLAFAVVLILVVPPVRGPLHAQDTIGTPEVHVLAQAIQQEVEVIRWHMGRPPEERPLIPVSAVAIRENFGQAMTLWRKANQLAVDLVGGGEPPPVIFLQLGEQYGPSHVHAVLSSVLARLQEIREGTGIVGTSEIEDAAARPALNPQSTPSDVFRSIVQSNRQLNRMLERQVQPGDVYQQVQQGIYHLSTILAAAGDPNPLPSAPAYEPGLRPGHVYGRLLQAFERLSAAFETLGLGVVQYGGGYRLDEMLTPSDVFDLAVQMASELEYLNGLMPATGSPLRAAHPGLRWPSDVYQQAGILVDQAGRLLAIARTNPSLFDVEGNL